MNYIDKSIITLSYILQVSTNHIWYIHSSTVAFKSISSDSVDGIYNPFGVNTSRESGYLDDCTALSHFRCAMGDLSGKLGALGLEPATTSPHKAHSFYDENLHLLGPFSGRYIYTWTYGLLHIQTHQE